MSFESYKCALRNRPEAMWSGLCGFSFRFAGPTLVKPVENTLQPVDDELSVCSNAGFPMPDGSCNCPSYVGEKLCKKWNCLNGGVLVDTDSVCSCPPGFLGVHCEPGAILTVKHKWYHYLIVAHNHNTIIPFYYQLIIWYCERLIQNFSLDSS